MEIFLIVIIIGLIIYFIYDKKVKTEEKNNTKAEKEKIYPYKKKYLLTKTEYNFYNIIKDKCNKANIKICPKVRLEDFIEITTKENKQKYRGYIKSRHIDFLLCDNMLNIKAAIELDDKSHNTGKAKESDNFKNKLYETIGIKLYRIKTTENYIEKIDYIIEEIKTIS